MNAIFDVDSDCGSPKYLQIINSITKSIKLGKLKKGDKILSINELSIECYLSRATVQKAYDILENEGIIQPVRGKGFYVARENVTSSYRVLLLFNKMSSYKQLVYNSFANHLDPDAIIDLKIHHGNTKIFNKLVETHLNEYDYFIIMPHFYDDAEDIKRTIKKIPNNKLIILDKDLDGVDIPYSSVCQDFKNDIIGALQSGASLISKYKRLCLVFPKFVSYPVEILVGFRKFCIANSIEHNIISSITDDTIVECGDAFVVIEEADLVNLIKRCNDSHYAIGSDVGIISYNDTALKEILLNGITVISTDHSKMGELAAMLITTNRKENIRNDFNLIVRNSL